jgi:Family of unknown function (DUF5317)
MWMIRRLFAVVIWLPLRSLLIFAVIAFVVSIGATAVYLALPCPRPLLEPYTVPALLVCCLGSCLNLSVFIANGFRMPVRCYSFDDENRLQGLLLHRPLDDSSKLLWLADIISLFGVGRVSTGDLLIVLGVSSAGFAILSKSFQC